MRQGLHNLKLRLLSVWCWVTEHRWVVSWEGQSTTYRGTQSDHVRTPMAQTCTRCWRVRRFMHTRREWRG